MHRFLSTIGVAVCLLAPSSAGAQDPAPAPQPPPILHEIHITGAKELSIHTVREAVPAAPGEPFTATIEQVQSAVERRYRDDGYTFAHVKAAFDQATGVLNLAIDEGVIDAVEFDGVDPRLATIFAQEFALRAGDVFNRTRARQALTALLRPTRGAVLPGRVTTSQTFTDTRDVRPTRRTTFDLVERDGQRILKVGLREPPGRFKVDPNLGGRREDWFTPVDGFVPTLEFGAAIFDHDQFNHAFIFGHVSIKAASGNVGYALGAERPFFPRSRLFVGAEMFDLTATDDHWQISSAEAGLAAVGPRRSYRDYYRRRGVQASSAFRIENHSELLFAFRSERHEALETTTEFSLWNDDEPFRPNPAATEGRLNAVIVGASIDGRGFDRESLETTYRRHQLESPFGLALRDPHSSDPFTVWRVDWTSEISSPGALQSDFDFQRHIISGRIRSEVSPHQEVAARVIGGWSGGVLPPQRQFAIGGIGSVHGYAFKESIGTTLALINLEYGIGWRSGPQLLGFLDVGRTTGLPTSPTLGSDTPWLKGAGWGIGLGPMRIDFGYKLTSSPGPVQVLLRFGRTF
jgi:surface antigen-like variable number repeat protein/surface antigen Omp85-like protein